MKETIGDIIKRLRKKRNLTQEQLAEQLNISSAAVSKWENNIGMPDISNIVPLANLFGVTTDELFGVNGIDKEAEIDDLLDEIFKMQEGVAPEDEPYVGLAVMEKYREALRQYPNNSTILCNAVSFAGMIIECNSDELINIVGEAGINILINERIHWAELIIKYSGNTDHILCAKRNLIEVYTQKQDWQNALQIAQSFPEDIYNIRDIRMAELRWQMGEKEKQQYLHCSNIKHLLEALGHQVFMLGNLYREKGEYEDALCCYNFMHGMINSLYFKDEYIPPFHDKGYPLYLFPAHCLIKLKRYDEAIDLLEKCVEYYQDQAKHYNKTLTLNTPLLKTYTFSYGYEGTAEYKDPIKAAEKIICNKAFDVLSNNDRYQKLLIKLK